MFCTNCGAPIEDGNVFCTACGAPAVPASSAAPSVPVINETPAPVAYVHPAPAAYTAPAPAAYTPPVSVPNSSPEVPAPASEPAPTTSHLKINMPGAETTKVVTPRPVSPESSAAGSFFSAAGSLGASSAEPARPAAPAPAAAPSYSSAPMSSPPYPAAPSYPVPPVAPVYTPPAEPASYDTGGFRESVPEAPVAPAVHYSVNPYDRYLESSTPDEPVKRKRKIWPLVLVIVLAALIAASAAAWFLDPGVKELILGKPELSFKEDAITLSVNETTDLNEILVLDHVDANKVRWQSDDDNHTIIKCQDGKITAKGAGTCEVKVFLAENEDVAAKIEITVVDPNAPEIPDPVNTAGDNADAEQSNGN